MRTPHTSLRCMYTATYQPLRAFVHRKKTCFLCLWVSRSSSFLPETVEQVLYPPKAHFLSIEQHLQIHKHRYTTNKSTGVSHASVVFEQPFVHCSWGIPSSQLSSVQHVDMEKRLFWQLCFLSTPLLIHRWKDVHTCSRDVYYLMNTDKSAAVRRHTCTHRKTE